MSLRQRLKDFASQNSRWSDRRLAAAFVKDIEASELESLLAEEFGHVRRGSTREIEEGYIERIRKLAATTTRHRNMDDTKKMIAELSPWLNSSYSLNGVRKDAKDMTYDDWSERLIMLQKQRDGIDRSIVVCERVMAVLESTGARTLRGI